MSAVASDGTPLMPLLTVRVRNMAGEFAKTAAGARKAAKVAATLGEMFAIAPKPRVDPFRSRRHPTR